MIINYGGFTPLSLSDYPEKPAAVVFFRGCLLSCQYCHNKQLKYGWHEVDTEKIADAINAQVPLIEAVVFSGGEPLQQPSAILAIKSQIDTSLKVGIETSGLFPKTVENLINRGAIDAVFLDIKAHDKEHYALVTRIDMFEKVMKCLDICVAHKTPVQCRTTVFEGYPSKENIEYIRDQILKPRGITDYVIQEARCPMTTG